MTGSDTRQSEKVSRVGWEGRISTVVEVQVFDSSFSRLFETEEVNCFG